VLENATIVIRNGLIVSVGANVLQAPAGARVWDLKGQTVYPGFIDAHADLGVGEVPQGGDVGPTHWNPQVRAWYSTTANFRDDSTRRTQPALARLRHRARGAQAGHLPRHRLGRQPRARPAHASVCCAPTSSQAHRLPALLQLGGMYPNSAMGTIALMKQTFMDAEWYIRAWAAYERAVGPSCRPRPAKRWPRSTGAVQGRQPVLFQTESEEEYLRAYASPPSSSSYPWFRGSGEEYRMVDVLKGRTHPLIIPLNFPDAPKSSSPEAALGATLGQLRHWYLAPANAAQLAAAGVPFAITTDGLSSLTQFLPNLRIAVARGLAPDKALAALTTVPAAWLGIERTHGTIAAGKVANLVVADGDLFTEESSVRDVWVQGTRYGVTRPPQVDPRGTWTITTDDAAGFAATLRLEGPINRVRGTIEVGTAVRDQPRQWRGLSPRPVASRPPSMVSSSATRARSS
jgi:hypothetical protein